MSKSQSCATLIIGVFILVITHASMQSGELPLRWSGDKITVANPNFWLFAGSFVGFGVVMVLGGLIYLAVEHKYLPNIDTKDGVQSVVYTLLILIASGSVGFVQARRSGLILNASIALTWRNGWTPFAPVLSRWRERGF